MTGAARFYGSLLRLYPRSYRQAFGAEMLQTFVDWHDDVAGADGRVGIRSWLPMVADEARNIVGQRVESLAASGLSGAHGAMLALAVLLVLVTGIGGRDGAVDRAAAAATSAPLRSEFARRIISPSPSPSPARGADVTGFTVHGWGTQAWLRPTPPQLPSDSADPSR